MIATLLDYLESRGLKVWNRPTGRTAMTWAALFVIGSIWGKVQENPAPKSIHGICLEMTRARISSTHPFLHFRTCLAFLYYAWRGDVLRMDDTGLYIQLEHWKHDQQKDPETFRNSPS